MRLNSIAHTPLRAVAHFKFKVDHHHFYEQNALTHLKMCFSRGVATREREKNQKKKILFPKRKKVFLNEKSPRCGFRKK